MKLCALLGKITPEPEGGACWYENLTPTVAERLTELLGDGVAGFVSNCEWDFALYCSETLTALPGYDKSQLYLCLPHERQSENWSESVRERYYDIHAQAETVEFVSREFTADCYELCDKAIIDKCDLLFTNDSDCAAAEYARATGKAIIICK